MSDPAGFDVPLEFVTQSLNHSITYYQMSYFQDIQDGIRTTLKGLQITMRHLRQATERRKPISVANDNYFEQQTGLVTVQYPHEQLPIPDNGRYRLHNEIDDCIVCDKCAKVCPVDCITIDAVKATEEIGRASDGSPIRLYAATFDIDMAKCCYCGLCTVVCPTECLTMEKKFDYSEYELGKLTYGFANLTPEEAEEKRLLYEQFVAEKAAQKAQQTAKPAATALEEGASPAPVVPAAPKRPVFRPTAKPKPADEVTMATDTPGVVPVHAEVDRPAAEASPAVITSGTDPATQEEHTVQPTGAEENKPVDIAPKLVAAKPAFRPTMRPPVAKTPPAEPAKPAEPETIAEPAQVQAEPVSAEVPKPKSPFRPTMKPKVEKGSEPVGEPEPPVNGPVSEELPKPKPAFRPTMKPKPSAPEPTAAAPADEPMPESPKAEATEEPTPPKPKPAFRPTMKPKNP